MGIFNDNKVKQLIIQNVLAVPGVAAVPQLQSGEPAIEIVSEDYQSVINININCFSYVNIWSVIRQVQIKASYVMEKLNQHKVAVKVNVNVFDIIEENI